MNKYVSFAEVPNGSTNILTAYILIVMTGTIPSGTATNIFKAKCVSYDVQYTYYRFMPSDAVTVN